MNSITYHGVLGTLIIVALINADRVRSLPCRSIICMPVHGNSAASVVVRR